MTEKMRILSIKPEKIRISSNNPKENAYFVNESRQKNHQNCYKITLKNTSQFLSNDQRKMLLLSKDLLKNKILTKNGRKNTNFLKRLQKKGEFIKEHKKPQKDCEKYLEKLKFLLKDCFQKPEFCQSIAQKTRLFFKGS